MIRIVPAAPLLRRGRATQEREELIEAPQPEVPTADPPQWLAKAQPSTLNAAVSLALTG
jgi:hypothetical protein